MNKQYFWTGTEDIEIDLTDLLHRLSMKWKQIAVCALVSAVILGGYGWMKNREAAEMAETEIAQEAALKETEKQAVEDAVRLENETRELETYLNHSVLMQLDPYHKVKYIMLYGIDHASRQELPKITESYLNFALNGGAADALLESGRWNMDKSCLEELIAAYQKTYSFPYQIIVGESADSSMPSESVFYIEIIGKNARTAKKMALDMEKVMKEYSSEVKKTVGNHSLQLVSSEESMIFDSGLQAQQRDKKAQLVSSQANLRTMIESFSKEQMAVYREAVSVKDGDSRADEYLMEKEAESDENPGNSIIYILFGMIGGAFVYCGIFSCWYIFSDTVKNPDEMKRLYTIPVYGEIFPDNHGIEKSRAIPGIQRDTYGKTAVQALNRIRFVCRKREVRKIYAAADFTLSEAENQCLKNMAEKLQEWGICMEVPESVSSDSEVWDSMDETGNILIVCRMGVTTHRMIRNTMNFCLENGIAVMGAVVFRQKLS